MLEREKFLGRGWSFPPTFVKKEGFAELEMVEAKEDIEQSLDILLSTSLGERVMQPRYGCNLKDYLFEPMSAAFIGRVRDLISNAILYYEPRIEILQLNVSNSGSQDAIEGRLIIELEYMIRTTNSRFNYVYNFYINEASNLTF
jgi:hypothetical protein